MSSGNVVVETDILASVVDAKGADIAEGVIKNSKHIKQTYKSTTEKTVALISASNIFDFQLKQLRTACNKELGTNPFASAHKVTHQEMSYYQLIRMIGKQHFMTYIKTKLVKMQIKRNKHVC